jgi:hypothetical protein
MGDVLAQPIKQACLVEKGLIPDPGNVFGKRVAQCCGDKLNRHEVRGQVWEYGKMLL